MPGQSYLFTLTAADAAGEATASVSVRAAAAPVRGQFSVRFADTGADATAAAAGGGSRAVVAFTTPLRLSATGWAAAAAEDGPLLYSFRYVLAGPSSASPESSSPPVLLSPFRPVPELAPVTLPAGLEAEGGRVEIQLCVALSALLFPHQSDMMKPRTLCEKCMTKTCKCRPL